MARRLLLLALLGALVTPAAAQAVVPGVVIGANTRVDEVAKTRESGARWVRLFVDWSVFDEASLARRAQAYKRAGIKVLVVVSYTPAGARNGGTKITPPSNPASYGAFLEYLGRKYGAYIDAYEMWNEPDERLHWENGPQPARYVGLLREGYNGVQRGDRVGDRIVVTGGMVGNNFEFLDALYKLGAKGYFDAVGVHTDLSCENDPPEYQYRDEQGRIGRYVFTGYREVAATMADHGERKPIWMTEMGWPTPGDGVKCLFMGKPMPGKEAEPGGVSYSAQAAYLRRGLECMQGDGLVSNAFWFSLQDISTQRTHEHRFGLIDAHGVPKPAFGALQAWSRSPTATRSCGETVDRAGPKVKIKWPPEGFRYSKFMAIRAVARDELPVRQMSLYVDGRSIGGRPRSAVRLDPWWGSADLARGDHELVVRARDKAGNWGQASVTFRKAARGRTARTARPKLAFTATRRDGRAVGVCATASRPAQGAPLTGKLRVTLDLRRGGGWQRQGRLTRRLPGRICRDHALSSAGKWRIRARLQAEPPYKTVASKPVVLRVG